MGKDKKPTCALSPLEEYTPQSIRYIIDRSHSLTHSRIIIIMSKSCAGMLEEMLKCAEQSKCYLSRSRSRSRRENSNSEEGGGNDDDDALEFCVNALMRTTTTNDDDDDDENNNNNNNNNKKKNPE